jgi:hypothetical protein
MTCLKFALLLQQLPLQVSLHVQEWGMALIVKNIDVRIIITLPSTMCKINKNLINNNCKKTPSYTFLTKIPYCNAET